MKAFKLPTLLGIELWPLPTMWLLMRLPVVVLLLTFCEISMFGDSKVSIDQTIAHGLELSIKFSRRDQGGLCPTNWSQLQFDFAYWNRELAEAGREPIQAQYVFVPRQLRLIGSRQGSVVIAKFSPAKDHGDLRRTVIYEAEDGDVRSTWIKESLFAQMLAQSDVKLPMPKAEDIENAKEELKIAEAQEQGFQRQVRQMTWKGYLNRIENWFLTPPSTNRVSAAGRNGERHIRPVPMILTILLVAGIGAGLFWFAQKRRRRVTVTGHAS